MKRKTITGGKFRTGIGKRVKADEEMNSDFHTPTQSPSKAKRPKLDSGSKGVGEKLSHLNLFAEPNIIFTQNSNIE